MQPLNENEPIVSPEVMITVFKFVLRIYESANVEQVTLDKLLHPSNAEERIDVTLSGMVMLARLVQPENAEELIVFTPSGIENFLTLYICMYAL